MMVMAIKDIGETIRDMIGANLVLGIEDIIILVTVLGCMIFMAKDLRLGLAVLFIFFASEFVVFGLSGLQTFRVFTGLMLTLVVMALSLYTSYSKKNIGVVP